MGDGSIDKAINRVLFCTSPLQVINARSAMDYMESNLKCNDYVVMVHPLLLENTKKQINHIAKILDYSNVIDLTFLGKNNDQKRESLSLIKKIYKIKTLLNEKINRHQELQEKISTILNEEIGQIEIVFFRMSYKYVDSLFINSQKQAQWYGIEDGIGDYVPRYWAFMTFNIYEIKHKIKSVFRSYLFFFISLFIIGNYKKSKVVLLKPKCKYKNCFTNIQKKSSICVGEFYKENITKLLTNNNGCEKKVIIIGSLIPDPRFKLGLYREVEIYNSIIDLIVNKHKINNDEIWYKHHPRLEYESWVYKKNNLNCSIYDFDDRKLVDVEFMNKHIRAVYSVGSTAILYAKYFFHKTSYLIDIRKEQCHPSTYKKYSYIAEKFSIQAIVV